MSTRVAERRRSTRFAAAYPVVLRGRRGKVLAQGRTADISETGVFVIVRTCGPFPPLDKLTIEITVPGMSAQPWRRDDVRTIRYACRVARRQALGQLLGMGLEFTQKLD